MNRDHFWLTDRQFARIAPHLPTDTRGKPRVDDRRVISGIIHVPRSGARWVDAPSVYGPRKTLQPVCPLGREGRVTSSKHSRVRAAPRRSSSSTARPSRLIAQHPAAKGGAQSGHWPLARRTDDQDPCPDRRAVPPDCFHADGWTNG